MPEIADETVQSSNADNNVRSRGLNADTNSFPQRLGLAIEGAGGQLAVARLIGVSSKTLSRYRAGAPAKHSTLDAIARATNVRLEWLASGEGPMRPGEAPAAPSDAAPPPQPAPPAGPLRLFSTVNMDRLAAAYGAARTLLAARGIHTPDPLDLVRIMTTIYDELTEVEARPSESLRD